MLSLFALQIDPSPFTRKRYISFILADNNSLLLIRLSMFFSLNVPKHTKPNKPLYK